MKKTIAYLLALVLLAAQSCVGAKVYRNEKNTRVAAETREKVLVQELLERRKEAAALIKTVGDLNRSIGQQEAEIKDLKAELTERTQSMGESASKLFAEKSALDKKLTEIRELLDRRNEILERVSAAQAKRKIILSDIQASLNNAFKSLENIGVSTTVNMETVMLTLPDISLFDPAGVSISASGKDLLATLADFLGTRPSLSIDIVAYTDNLLPPKDKTLKDTWDWSLQRATNVARMLVREYNANANQLTPVGRGEFYPITSNETPEGRAKNRRTVVVFRPVMPAIPQAE